ncbi:unnamed protein product [Candida verbasci]|uniref:phosphoinositide 5-phosphatase n=1 Tax=Candida verbasci TaxID=1227364 RepID=A0A9W4XGQ1_9ASCO|nr:unnamed protein product [Candida verbasci]
MRLYLNEKPRTFIITTTTHALIIRHPNPDYKHKSLKDLIPGYKQKENNNNKNKVIVEFVLKDYLDLNQYKDITPRNLIGCLGLLSIKNKIFLGFITREELTALPTINDKIFKITGTEFFCINNDEYDYLLDKDIEELSFQEREKLSPAGSIRKILSTGAFYYSKNFDITSNIQERGINNSEFELFADSAYFSRFMWNGFMLGEFLEFRNRLPSIEQKLMDQSGFYVIIARGYAKTVNISIDGNDGLLTLISKQSSAKEGPLFGDWGCDGNGYVSNYLESEIIIYTKRLCLSYVIIRGNVPMYWEMEHNFSTKSVLTSSGKKIVFPRSFEASQDAFTRHMDRICGQYGDVHILNALSDKSYKGVLSASFEEQIKVFLQKYDNGYKILYTHIPIASARLKKIGYTGQNPYDIISLVSDSIVNFGGLFFDNSVFIGKQLGVFRINSFDSLSKANFLSKVISQEVIELAFKDIGIILHRDVKLKHAKLWEENDDCISKLTLSFVSTSDKLQSSKTSKHKSVKNHITKKYLYSVVESKPKEIALMKLLGRLQDQTPISFHNPLHDYISKELNKHSKEFTSSMDISLFASTFNVNGTVYDGDIDNWIYPEDKTFDLIFIGLQEIVDLNAGQMVNTDTRNKTQWERKILQVLQKKDKYMVMWSGQLGGLALFFFVKEDQVKHVSNVECSFKKTGFGGVSANKGGLAVSFQFSDTSLCFVSSHFAAGLSNIEERHHNYKTLIKGIQFSKNKRVQNHDVVIWLGDFNYRINLPIEQVKPLILQKKFNNLFEFDQLNLQMANGESFPFFAESEIQFPPTYKFDNGTKVYDTSEKQRIPAWTDRILYLSRKNLVKPLNYNCDQNLIFSDHRPVYATFIITANIVNQQIKKNLSNELYENYKKVKSGGINDILSLNKHVETNEESESLPPPSSDKSKWWLDGGKPAKVSIPNLNDGEMVINPWKPINPFEKTNEPEFVLKKEIDVLY